MKVILLDNVEALGEAGDTVNVKDGYARNYLMPKNKALPATNKNIQKMAQMQKHLEAVQNKARTEAEQLAKRIDAISLTLARRSGENEKLFGSVTSMDIERALQEEGIEVDRKKILLDEPIKSLGIYQVDIKLHTDVTTHVKVWVVKA